MAALHQAKSLVLFASVLFAGQPLGKGITDQEAFDELKKLAKISKKKHGRAVELGPRPFYLVEDMDDGPLKEALRACRKGPFYKTVFSIGHRGAPLQFPEHTNILLTDLAGQCSQSFTPANPITGALASARCCTSDITLQEFTSLCGKMEAVNVEAATVE